jgi:hypothetical protein
VVLHGGGGGLAIRKGPWKRIAETGKKGGKGGARAGELYNLAADLNESKDRAAAEPDKVKELTALLKQIRENGRSRPSKR